MKFSVIMSVWQPWELMRHAVACLASQTHRDWELIVVSDGQPDLTVNVLLRSLGIRCPHHRTELVVEPRVEGIWGNRARRSGLDHCEGDYVCWVNHDNVIYPEYLSTHAKNIEKAHGCLSVVNIDYWLRMRCLGRFPVGKPRLTKIDLLNFAMPLEIARQVDVFGPETERIHHADWLGFEAASKLIPVEQVPQDDPVVGVHF